MNDQIIYTKNVGQKYHADGSVRHFPGNTIICMVDTGTKLYEELVKVRDMLQEMKCVNKFTFMPPSSYHMTAIEGVCDQVRKQEYWTKFLPLDTPLEEVDKFFIERYSTVAKPESFSMKFDHIRIASGITLRLFPETDKVAQALKSFRDDVSEKLGLRFPDHDNYGFHISLAYNIIQLNDADKTEINEMSQKVDAYLKENLSVFKISSPRLLRFENMFKFSEKREMYVE